MTVRLARLPLGSMVTSLLAVALLAEPGLADRHDRHPSALAMTFSLTAATHPNTVPVTIGLEYGAGVRLRDVMLLLEARLSGGVPARGFAIWAWGGLTGGYVGRGEGAFAPLVTAHLGATLLHKEGGGQVSGGGFSPGLSVGARWLPSQDSGIGFFAALSAFVAVPGVRSSTSAWVPVIIGLRLGSIAL